MQKKITLSIATALLLVSNSYASQDLGAITIVGATKSEQSIKDVTSDVEVITGVELKEKHITTVLDALRLSGISIAQSGAIGEQSSIFMNGLSSGNTLVLIDGIKYNDPTGTEGQAQLEHLMVNDIDRIEIINGAQSGIWGANAVAGVVNIITKKATKELQVNTTLEYGSSNTKKASVNVSQKVGALSYYVGLNYLKTDGISAQTPDGEKPSKYEDDGYQNRTLNTKLNYTFNDNSILKFDLLDINAKVAYDPFGNPNGSNNELTQKNRLYKFALRHYLSKNNYLNLSYSKTNFHKLDPNGYTSEFKGYNNEIALDSKFAYLNNSFLLAGVSQEKSDDTINDKQIKSKGIYITNNNTFNKLIMTESLRRDSYDLFDDKTTGKVGAKYNITNNLSVSANYGTAYKVPSLYQLFTPLYGNQALKPETTKSKDISVNYKTLKITIFENDTTDLIGYDPNTYVNKQVDGRSKFKGYKITYQKDITTNTLLTANYMQQSAKDQNGKDLQRRIHNSAKATLNYYGFRKVHLGATINYIGTRYDDLAQTKQTGRYTLVNTVANYTINKNLTTYIKINNLTNKLYQEVYGYGTLDRTITVGLNAKF